MAAEVPPNRPVDTLPPIYPKDERISFGRRLTPFVLGKARPAVLHHRRLRRDVGARKEAISVDRRGFGENPLVIVPMGVSGILLHFTRNY